MRKLNRLWTVASLAALTATATAGIVHDEGVDGDLSGDPGAPTALTFTPGSNVIHGQVTTGGGGTDDTRDFITFTIGAGQSLTSLTLLAYEDENAQPANRGFHAINLGNTSFIPGGGTAGSFLGGDHLDPTIGVDLLPTLATAPLAGTGFTVPLGPGTYSYVVQQTGGDISNYSLDFGVVPEPGTLALLGLSATLLLRRR